LRAAFSGNFIHHDSGLVAMVPGGLARHLSETLWPIMILGVSDAEA